jgi:ribA/ribD-fused uncharacterized protein
MIRGFSGEYRFLSNFYMIDIVVDGVTYKSSEHYYMSEKTSDDRKKQLIMDTTTASAAKRIGKTLKLRNDWEEKYKNQSMLRGLTAKFYIPEMCDKLLSTGDLYLEETNHWNDVYWGVCDGVGENMLGRMLMYIRKQLK